jgi:FMN phosphatase YigB (HAD superfamily)
LAGHISEKVASRPAPLPDVGKGRGQAEAEAALRELGATLKASTNAPKLHTLKLLNELGLDEEEDVTSSS